MLDAGLEFMVSLWMSSKREDDGVELDAQVQAALANVPLSRCRAAEGRGVSIYPRARPFASAASASSVLKDSARPPPDCSPGRPPSRPETQTWIASDGVSCSRRASESRCSPSHFAQRLAI